MRKKACIYYIPEDSQSFNNIKKNILEIKELYNKLYEIKRIIVETGDFEQLDSFINGEINDFDILIINKNLEEFYMLVFKSFILQKKLEVVII